MMLQDYPNVVGTSLTEKITGGKLTGKPCIRVVVDRKVPESDLEEKDIIPKRLSAKVVKDGKEIEYSMDTDVVKWGTKL